MLESDIQEAVVKFIDRTYPGTLYCASAGGMRTSMRQAIKMKRTGYKKGFPDLQIMHPTKLHHGLFIERGYRAVICKGLDACILEIITYMNERVE
jgi:hypothetical protein